MALCPSDGSRLYIIACRVRPCSGFAIRLWRHLLQVLPEPICRTRKRPSAFILDGVGQDPDPGNPDTAALFHEKFRLDQWSIRTRSLHSGPRGAALACRAKALSGFEKTACKDKKPNVIRIRLNATCFSKAPPARPWPGSVQAGMGCYTSIHSLRNAWSASSSAGVPANTIRP